MKAITWILAAALCWLSVSPACAVTEGPTLQSKAGMVTAAHPLAARAGAEILERGGNAIDASIAVSLALGVVEPYASGIGGEGYLVAVMADGRELAVDFRSTAPAMATYENLDKAGKLSEVRYTAKGYCVAGVPAGIGEALKFASLPLADLAASFRRVDIARLPAAIERPASWDDYLDVFCGADGAIYAGDGHEGRILREIFAVGDPRGMRILEVGAGTGRDSLALARAGAQVVTLDYSPKSLELIHRAASAEGLRTAFVVRPQEHGPSQEIDLAATGDWDIVTDSFNGIADALGC